MENQQVKVWGDMPNCPPGEAMKGGGMMYYSVPKAAYDLIVKRAQMEALVKAADFAVKERAGEQIISFIRYAALTYELKGELK